MTHSKECSRVLYASALLLAVLFGRIICTQQFTYTFLAWNLFLAWVPLMMALYAFKRNLKKNSLLVVSFGWFIFFPNAPYLITDIFHIGHLSGAPTWYDALLLFLAASNGVSIAFLSLRIMELQWQRAAPVRFHNKYMAYGLRVTVLGSLFLFTAFGIYLGRVLRFNSWDIIADTGGIFNAVTERIAHPAMHKNTWMFTLLYAAVLFGLSEIYSRKKTILWRRR